MFCPTRSHSPFHTILLTLLLASSRLAAAEPAPVQPADVMARAEEASATRALLAELFPDVQRQNESDGDQAGMFDLEDCLQAALESNLDVGASKKSVGIARSQVSQARSAARPRLNVQAEQVHVDRLTSFGTLSIGDKDPAYSHAVLQQPLFTSGRIELGIAASRDNQKAAEWGVRATKEDVILRTIKGYLAVLSQNNRLRIASESLQVYLEHLALTEDLAKGGVILSTDVAATRVKMLEARQKVLEEENALEIRRESLAELIGMPTDSLARVKQIDAWSLAAIIPEGPATMSVGLLPELEGLSTTGKMLRKRVLAEQRGRLPSIVLQAKWDSGSSFKTNFPNWNAAVAIDLPVFDGGISRAKAEQARRELEKTNLLREQISRQLGLAAQTSYLKVQEIARKIGLAIEALKTAHENLEQNRINYQAGTVLNTDVLNAQLLYSDARIRVNNAVYEYLENLAAYYRHTGHIAEYLSKVLHLSIEL